MWKQLVWERSTYWGTGWLGEFLPLLQCRRSGLKVLWQGQVTPKHFLDIFHVFVRHPKVMPAQKGMHVWHWKALKDKGMHLWYWRSQEIKYHQQSLWHAQTIEVQFLNAGTWSVCTTTTTKKIYLKNFKKLVNANPTLPLWTSWPRHVSSASLQIEQVVSGLQHAQPLRIQLDLCGTLLPVWEV